MRWSIPIGSMFGFPVRLHWTVVFATVFLLILSEGMQERVAVSILILGISLSVLLHEIAHAAVARRRGIQIDVILLTPLGGIAVGEGLARNPESEIRIAIAGPIVSLALGTALLVLSNFLPMKHNLLGLMALVNLAIGLFNLVPAFPLDGGRIFRALLGRHLNLVSATRWAAGTSRGIALAAIAGGLYFHQFWIGLLGVVIYFAGRAELLSVRFRVFISERTASDVMDRTVQTLAAGLSIREAIAKATATTQRLFPVCFGDTPLGVISVEEMFQAVKQGKEEVGVSNRMSRNFVVGHPSEPLETLLRRMANNQTHSALILSEGLPVGVVAVDDVLQATQ